MYDAKPPSANHASISEHSIRPAPEYSVIKDATPTWVKPISSPKGDSKYPAILEDIQLDCASKTIYQHHTQRIDHKIDALFSGNMRISFNPYYQILVLHSCDIIRVGKRVDRLNQAKIFVAQLESDSDSLIFNGDLQALIFLDDVNEGDLLEYSYSIVGYPFDRWDFKWLLQGDTPVQKMHLRIVKDQNCPCSISLGNTPEELKIHDAEEEIELTLEPSHIWNNEPNQPADLNTAPYIEFTEFASWNEVVQDELKLYQLDPDFALNPEAIVLIKMWERGSLNPEEAALQALRFVQDKIRYLALCYNDGGWNPASPAETLNRRYGDCKAKTQLFRAFLNLLSIPSTPVLVHTIKQEGIESSLPIRSSNHVIVRIDLEDGPVYVDPTAMYQGGPLRESYLPYRKGLALSEKTEELSSIPLLHPEIDEDRATTFSLTSSGVAMTHSFSLYGESANHLRMGIALKGKKKCAETSQKFYESIYGPAKLISYEFQDDRDANRIEGSYTLEFENLWAQDTEEENYFYYSVEPLFYFNQDFDPERKTALRLPLPIKIRERVVLSSGGMTCMPIKIEHPVFDFTANAISEREACFELNSKLDRLEPEELEEYAEELYKGKISSYVFIYEHPKEARRALQVAKILAKP